ncbi:hypothetical protein AGR4B_Lc10263 [Agrobacterium tumefaciens str. CFBP 5621]|nr:hypothetical protein AGR4B_Lc10263 [Agrobacterium tumefaciens str. CFBP 5621]
MEDMKDEYLGHRPVFLIYLSQETRSSLVLLTMYRTRTSR